MIDSQMQHSDTARTVFTPPMSDTATPKMLKCVVAVICMFALFRCDPASGATPTAAETLQRVIGKLKDSPSVQATFRVTTSDGAMDGSILLSGNRFKLDTSDFTTWFDGRTQWAYSPRTGEVNISEPTFEELAQINPFAVVSSLQTGYNARRLQAPKGYERLELTPKKNAEYAQVILTVNAATNLPSEIQIKQTDGLTAHIAVTSVKTGKVPGASTFRFNKALYPNAEVVDLR